MNYHDTVPSEDGAYCDYDCVFFRQAGAWRTYEGQDLDAGEIEKCLPLIGPLPDTPDEMLTLACEVAFARMVVADYQYCTGNTRGPQDEDAISDVMPRLGDCENRFVRKGERSLSLLRDMQRVTRELTREQQETP